MPKLAITTPAKAASGVVPDLVECRAAPVEAAPPGVAVAVAECEPEGVEAEVELVVDLLLGAGTVLLPPPDEVSM